MSVSPEQLDAAHQWMMQAAYEIARDVQDGTGTAKSLERFTAARAAYDALAAAAAADGFAVTE